MDDLLDVMREARRLAASDELLRYEIDGHIRALLKGGGNRVGMNVLFLPTGPLQELSLDEGWGDEFCALADRFDVAVRAYGHYCAVCSKLAGTLVVEGNELRRESFTSTLTQPVTASVRAVIGDAHALYGLDSGACAVLLPPLLRQLLRRALAQLRPLRGWVTRFDPWRMSARSRPDVGRLGCWNSKWR